MSSVRRIVSLFPNWSFVRRKYNQKKVAFYSRTFISQDQIQSAESNLRQKSEIVFLFNKQFPREYAKISNDIQQYVKRAPVYQNRQNDDFLKQEMFFCNIAYGFTPDEFLCYCLEEKSTEQRQEFVSDRELMKIVYQMNDRIDIDIFNDKSKTYNYYRAFYGREAVTIKSRKDYELFHNFILEHPIFVKKKVKEAMGRSVELVDLDGSTNPSISDNYFYELINDGKYILEEKIPQDPEMSFFNESSVNTIRCITFLTTEGVVVPYCFMKCGRSGSFVDNGGAGGILIGVDIETGKLNTDGFDEFHTRYTLHPDSHKAFKGYQLPKIDEAINLAKQLSAQCPTVKFIGWDFAYSDQKWVIVEGNGMSQLIGPQTVQERGVKEEVFSFMKKMKLLTKI